MRRCIAISAAAMFLTLASCERPSAELSSGQELLQRARQALKTSGKARVAGTPASWYRLDSGGSGFLTLHAPFVEKWRLLEGGETTAASSTGLGGTVAARTGTIKWFELGSHRFDDPTVVFSTATVGSFTDPYLAGNIGIDVLRSFTVIMDFAGSRVAFLETGF